MRAPPNALRGLLLVVMAYLLRLGWVLVPSPDPTIGVPTKAMYRFAAKFSEGNENQKFKTGTMFFPSLGSDFGGTQGIVDTGRDDDANGTQDQRFTDDITQYNRGQIESISPILSPDFDGLLS